MLTRSVLRTLGFLDANNKPSAEYARLKNEAEASKSIGQSIRKAYGPLFAANENAHTLPTDALRGLVAQVAGSDSVNTSKIMGTLSSLIRLANFNVKEPKAIVESERANLVSETPEEEAPITAKMRTEFHYNIQIHLPANGTEEMYLNIFNALRKVFK